MEEINKNNYDSSNIKVLEGLAAVRKRPGMYIGDTNVNGLHHMVYEVVDNSIDEAMAGYCNKIDICVEVDGSISIEDNGRGIPTGIHPTEGISAATVVLTVLHAGGKFDDDTYKVAGGLHGVGVSVVNALSSQLNLTIYREGKIHFQEFKKGEAIGVLEVIGETKKRGTKVQFWVDDTIFNETTDFQSSILMKRFREMSFLNPGIEINYEDKRNNIKEVYKSENGLLDYVKFLNKNDIVIEPITFSGEGFLEKENNKKVIVDIALLYNSSYNESIYSFVNGIKTLEGGTHESGFKEAITRCVGNYLTNNASARDKDFKLVGEDTREGMVAIVSVKVSEPQFEGQTKSKLGTFGVKQIVKQIVQNQIDRFLEENPILAKIIMEKSLLAAKGREASKKAREIVRKTADKNSISSLPGKLADCQSKKPEEKELYLVEGDSAAGSAKQGRDRFYQAILPLKGKILNVEKSDINKILKSEEIKNLITALGVDVLNMEIDKIRYHKIIIMTDADVDGSHIQTLLLTLFFRYLKPVIDKGYLYIAQPPLYRFKKGKKEIYLKDDKALNEFLIKEILEDIEGERLSNKRFLLLTTEYKSLLNDINKRFPGHKVLRKIIEENVSNVSEKLKVEEIIKELNYNILSKSESEDSVVYFIQTENGVEELNINSVLFEDNSLVLAKEYYTQLKGLKGHIFNVDNCIEEMEDLFKEVKKGAYIQRYKGLGEMNPEQLWETTMKPENRTLLKIEITDEEKTNENFNLLMGDEVEPRKEFILKNAKKVKNIDI